tara:strand:+ start:269 stop:463 length:195 start_codon:yes stop_codon:yes gene_type:complete
MKTYIITKTITNYIEAKDDKELYKLYGEGVVDEVLADINTSECSSECYVITDKKGNVVLKEKYE